VKSVSSLATAALLCACLLSCGTSPTPRFYSLNALSQGEDAAPASDLGIGVGPLYIPRYLERPQIVTRSGESQLSYDQFNRWGGSLESEVLRVLGENLGILLGTDRIAVYPRRVAIRTDYRVRLDFERFEGEGDDILALRVRWVLMPESGEAIAVELTTVREPVEGSGVGALVAAHSRALAELSRQIAARIRALEASADAS
jgi:uncharacterized lipoprotein YmbA